MNSKTKNKIRKPSPLLIIASAAIPLAAVVGILFLFLSHGTGLELKAPAPVENLEFERMVLQDEGFEAHVINTGPEALTIAQVQVGLLSRASWEFQVNPGPTIARLGRAVVQVPYPWTPGEPYEIVLITSNGLIFTHEIAIAVATPKLSLGMMGRFALLGIYVGVLPVFLGIGWLPFLRSLPEKWYFFLLNLAAGILLFLGVDTLEEALEHAADVPGPFQGVGLILIGVSLSIGLLYTVSGWFRKRRPEMDTAGGLVLAYSIAFGIGMHNLGEGLAIGGSYALGEFAAGTMLVLGFTLHNLTEGVAVVSPVVQSRFAWWHLIGLGTLAGVPTIGGTLLGAFAFTATWAVLLLAVGTGAVMQVVFEITRFQIRGRGAASLVSGLNLAGFSCGLAIMYVTGLLVII